MNENLIDGYYLSCYCDIDEIGNTLKVSSRHDHNVSLWKKEKNKIELVYHWELERLSGYKHHGIPFFSKEDFYTYIDSMINDIGIKREEIIGYIGMNGVEKNFALPANDTFSVHSLCHLYTSIGMDSELYYTQKILALALDGEPDSISDPDMRKKYFYTGAYMNNGKIDLFSIDSPGAIWTEAVEQLSMPEGTLMALATASKSVSYEDFELPLDLKTNTDILAMRPYVKRLCEEIMSYDMVDSGTKYNFFDERFTEEENKISMIMKIVQEYSLKIIDRNIANAISKYNIDTHNTYIALSGGYALNCPTNTYIMNKYQFKKQLIMPCVNDGGQSVGMGLYFFYTKMQTLRFKYATPYLGGEFYTYDKKFVDYIEDEYEGLDYIVDDIQKQPIIWYDNRSESGPRALGHRSILGDPRKLISKDRLNIIKKREWWRPVAPIVLADKCSEWFVNSFDSKYMLNNFFIRDEKREDIPAVAHLDGTARVQTVSKSERNLYDVLTLFYKKTGVPVLCNTSLNDKGEPIINNIDQAFNFALRKKIMVIYINGRRIKLKDHDKYYDKKPLERACDLFIKYDDEYNREKINPYRITSKEYGIYKYNPGGYLYDFTNINDVKRFRRTMGMIKKVYDSKVNAIVEIKNRVI